MSYTYKDNNPFYNEVSSATAGEINSRSAKYAARARGTKSTEHIHYWLHGKTAYVYIKAGDKTILEPPKKGFKDVYGKDLFPPPVVTSVRISNEGDYGSLIKAEINFTVFTLDELSKFSTNLLYVGIKETITIDYGWTTGGNGGTDNFVGYVYNYNWTLNADGGFDCTSYLVGEGYFTLGVQAGAFDSGGSSGGGLNPNNPKNVVAARMGGSAPVQDPGTSQAPGPGGTTLTSGTVKLSPMDWVDALLTFDLTTGGTGTRAIPSLTFFGQTVNAASGPGAAVIEIPISNPTPGSAPPPSPPPPTAKEPILYVTLDYICAIINTALHKISAFAEHNFYCNGNVSLGHQYSALVSANPRRIIFPGYTKYDSTNLADGLTISMGTSSPVDLSKILISAQCLRDIISSIKSEFSARSNFKDTDESLSSFFRKIFNEIEQASGGLYKLTLVNPVAAALTGVHFRSWLIMDTQYIGGGVNVQTIPTMKSGTNSYAGICRNISMTSTLPNAMATAQFISAASTLSGKAVPVNDNDVLAAKLDLANISNVLRGNAGKALTNGFTPDDIAGLRGSLEQYKSALAAIPGSVWSKGFPIPINLQITFDGIKGFRFGNTITIDYLPAGYSSVVFTVTKVEHNIQDNDWTTTISTVCRLKV